MRLKTADAQRLSTALIFQGIMHVVRPLDREHVEILTMPEREEEVRSFAFSLAIQILPEIVVINTPAQLDDFISPMMKGALACLR